ncbi:mannitol dehydrogenase [Paraoerskovia sediminicola]|uniref:Mannitol-1-phosphate 5-dehydrogenase n=1 Tax=Paraoerskovia sediminicola TaxID=1138587 RepID=A0ABN6X9D8_9CELL|nr:mannitol dehydrogenase family protein [Paraoerskovia sediminicola]BDZ41414.1 mannitol dehydrogenase [Paraoerskovia sediminicola]
MTLPPTATAGTATAGTTTATTATATTAKPDATPLPALPRLDRTSALPDEVRRPVAAPSDTGVGIVHLGIGAFHRAHQAVCTQDAMDATVDLRWGILGVTQRSRTVVDQLRPQGGAYGVLTTGEQDSVRVIGAVVDAAHPATETRRVLDTIAAPTTHLVTLTVTEKGYSRGPDGGLDQALVGADLAALRDEETGRTAGADPVPSTSAVGLLVRGLAARRRAGGSPITVLTCDNMVDNGRVLAALVRDAVRHALPGDEGDALRAWLDTSVTFPCSMVDRIVPATTDEHRRRAEAVTGVRDDGLVVAEPFFQWVVEDSFAGPRPAWERGGATIVDDVAPYERAKLRMLNGTHSLIAYAGAVAGHVTIADAVRDPAIEKAARAYLFEDALPGVDVPGMDLPAYGEEILARFADPGTGHTTIQVAMDGSQKIPFRWAPVAADSLAAGRSADGVAAGLAAWVRFVVRAVQDDGLPLVDPRAQELRAAVAGASASAGAGGEVVEAEAARALLSLPGLLSEDVRDAMVERVAEQLAG